MTKEILVFDKGICVGQVEVEIAVGDLVSAFTCLAEDGSPIYQEDRHGLRHRISKEVYCRIEKNVDVRDEEDD